MRPELKLLCFASIVVGFAGCKESIPPESIIATAPSEPAQQASSGPLGNGTPAKKDPSLQGQEKFAALDVFRNTTEPVNAELFIQNADGYIDVRFAPEKSNASLSDDGGKTPKWIYHSPLQPVTDEKGLPFRYVYQFMETDGGAVVWANCAQSGSGVQIFCYYTTDGTEPDGSGGIPSGTTKVATFSWKHNSPGEGGKLTDWWTSSPLENPPKGASLKYKIGASKAVSP